MKYIRMYMNTIKADSYNHLCLYHKTILPVRTTFQVTKPSYMILLDSDENSCIFSPTTQIQVQQVFSSKGKMHSIQAHLCQHREKLQLKTASLHHLKTDSMQITCFSPPICLKISCDWWKQYLKSKPRLYEFSITHVAKLHLNQRFISLKTNHMTEQS